MKAAPQSFPPLCHKVVESFRADGSLMDLARPMVEEIDFCDMAGRLSRIARFNGAPLAGAFSVAQHSVMGAEALLAEGEDSLIAALFLLHDGHEYLIGDKTRPFQMLLAEMMNARFGPGTGLTIRSVIAEIKGRWDEAIYAAAGLPAPSAWTNRMRSSVSGMDERMLHAEALALFGGKAIDWVKSQPRRALPKLKGSPAKPWGPADAEFRFLELFDRLIGIERRTGARALHAAHVATANGDKHG
ncbi:hypothetical protein J5N58_06790 [Rhizobium cremeum]|uniref:hypothetical protein n=1 Tax=Rhizobium cremeum TaxID=2813827 RepID=UPI001FD21347|nr:hypothetical protein [Rhizobium cremeum]MCJ7996657.1 hypothetical protein [Rhizobium cremeum]MCJ7999381.1 hypothetical protein [Rhizobium cremeum]